MILNCPRFGIIQPENKCDDCFRQGTICGAKEVKLSESPSDFSGDPAILIEEVKESKLYQCPYSKATTCVMDEGCASCETFGEYLNTIKEEVKVDSIEEAATEYADDEEDYYTAKNAFIAGAKSEAAKQYWENYFKHN
jgi:hypothetical protein